jgi:penicillin-binding protein 1A
VRRLAQIALALGLLVVLAAAVGLGLFQALILRDLPELYSLTDYRPNLITEVRAVDGRVFAQFYRERREVVPIEQIPSYVVHAFVAAEDDSFYEHEGLDYPGIARAMWTNLWAGGIKQGGSTITQQVAKTFLLSSERSYVRKLKDMVLAQRIERHLNKNEILYLYLNQIYLGSGAYGVQAAARIYFGKSIDELTLAEAALIAGVVPAPSRYTPFVSPEKARGRQEFVLRRMAEEGYISEEERQQALEEELELASREPAELRRITAYFGEEVRRYLIETYGADDVLTGGLQVTTTLDIERQGAAYEAVREGLLAHDRRSGYRGPLRVAAEEEWPTLLEELAAANGEPPWEDGALLEALVVEVKTAKGHARLALGAGAETFLTLDDVAWARKPDPEVDGQDYRIDRISRALERGQVVQPGTWRR